MFVFGLVRWRGNSIVLWVCRVRLAFHGFADEPRFRIGVIRTIEIVRVSRSFQIITNS
ncbi:hypothetical protein X941_5717 [Burkholderia pseudomallei MSHR5569]|nr:hypothetical protein X941_5717 [Burkholderia pseudomallei MSHR5569]